MSNTLKQHPDAINQLAEDLKIDLDCFINETDVGRRGFFRYGRKEADACRYCLDPKEGHIIGLCIRGQKVKDKDLSWMEKEAFQRVEDLYFGENEFARLDIPASWTNLRRIDLSGSPQLSRVRFLGAADRLERLEITDSGLVGLALPTSGCPHLQFLDLSRNAELTGLTLTGPCSSLHSLHLRAAPELETLAISTPLPLLDTLELSGCERLEELPAKVIMNSPLERLYVTECYPKNCPRALLEDKECALVNAQSWFHALQRGSTENRIVKLLINGNGGVGKSTLWCALRNLKDSACTCEDHITTHGIELTVEALSLGEVDFRGWDFGGQEVYQGTHRLFITDGAVQVLVLDHVNEEAAESGTPVPDRATPGETVINLPLNHFYTRQSAASSNSQFLVVQTKKGEGHNRHPAALQLENEHDLSYEYLDAKKRKGVRGLREDLQDLAQELPIYGMSFPSSWLAVREWLADGLRNNDTTDTPLRSLSRADFSEIVVRDCEVMDNSQIIDALLTFLHAAGDVYIDRQHLGETVIIDLRWALDGIYRPLRRGDFQRSARDANGRLHVDVIYPNTHAGERELFLEFMQSCGMCFPADRDLSNRKKIEYYIFPAFLREEPLRRVRIYWKEQTNPPNWSAALPYRDIAAMHALICDLGRKTTEGQLWRTGIDLLLVDIRELEENDTRLPETSAIIELVAIDAENTDYALTVTFDEKSGSAWWPSVQEWINEHFGDLNWQANEAARSQVQGEELKSRVGEPVAIEQIPDANGVPVLWFFSTPVGAPAIPVYDEIGRVTTSLQTRSSKCRGHYAFIPEPRLTYSKLIRDAKDVNPRLLHFTGHGDEEGLLFHNEDDNGIERKSPSSLASAFRDVNDFIQEDGKEPQLLAVLLNSCLSVLEAEAISREGLYVIGYEEKLKSKLANTFAVAFYERFAETNDVTLAFKYGVSVGQGNRNGDADNYQLYYQGKNITP